MIKRSQGFTLIEMVIALSLSSFIVLGMIQTYRNAMTVLQTVRDRQEISRKACLLFNQLERDFSSMYIPYLEKEIIPTKEEDQARRKSDSAAKRMKVEEKKRIEKDEKKKQELQAEKYKKFLIGLTDDRASVMHDEKRMPLFKSINFITTHPLQVHGLKRVRLVRVKYELVRDRGVKLKGRQSYQLYRKETVDIKNSKVKDDDANENKTVVRKHLITDNIKDLALEYVYQVEQEGDQEPQEMSAFTWGDKFETKGIVPRSILIHLTLWDQPYRRDFSYAVLIPVFSYPTQAPPKKDKKKEAQEDSSKKEDEKSGTEKEAADKKTPSAGEAT